MQIFMKAFAVFTFRQSFHFIILISLKLSKCRVIAKRREEIFFNFPSRMRKKWFFTYEKQAKSHISCGKGRHFFQFPFPHVKREEIVFPFSFLTITLSKCRFVSSYTKSIIFMSNIQNWDFSSNLIIFERFILINILFKF